MTKKELLRFTLYTIIIYLTCGTFNPASAASHPLWGNGTHFCGVIDGQSRFHQSTEDSKHPDNRNYARTFAANLNVGEPRTVRLIYFLPNDRPYQAEVVQKMKDEIRTVQTFFADQMEAHGYGRRTFRVETDSQGEPKVHRVAGRHPDSHYLDNTHVVYDELREVFNYSANIYLTVIDNSTDLIDRRWGGTGSRREKQGGEALVISGFGWGLVAHELGHAFGLQHDFRDGAYIMSYGPRLSDQLSACHAEYLSVHPYFNPDTPIYEVDAPTIKLISPRTYSPGATSVPVRIQVNDSDGLHQVILHAAQPDNRWSVKRCRGFSGERSAIFKFDYDGVIPSAHDPSYSRNTSLSNPLIHPIVIEAVDMNGDVDSPMWGGGFRFVLFSEALEPLTKVSGDDLRGLPNTPLPVPFVVELRDLNDGSPRREVPVRFTVTAGRGRLSVERVKTDHAGRAESTLTLGPNFGRNTVEVSAEGLTVTFNAVAGAPVDIPDHNLRAAIEDALGIIPGTPIAPAEMVTLTRLEAKNDNISNLTGLEEAANLTHLNLSDEYVEAENRHVNSNSVSDLSPLSGLTKLTELWLQRNAISDISPLAGLTSLTRLSLGGNSVSDISAMAGLTNLTELWLWNNNISDISPLASLIKLKRLDIPQNSISDISMVAGLINLTRLNVDNNAISEISVVSGLTHLTELYLGGNSITDISAITGLTHLTRLYLWNNAISDTSALAGLTNLTDLNVDHNSVSNISAVSGLTNLTRLSIRNNSISDVSAVKGLTQLTQLNLSNNAISDVSPLLGVNLTGTEWDSTGLYLEGNLLSYLSINTHIPAMQTKGIEVKFDNRTLTTLLAISGVITELDNLLIVEVRDSNNLAFAGVPVTFAITSGGGTLSTTRTTTDENGRAQSRFTLGSDGGTSTVRASVEGISESVTFNNIVVNIPDLNLRAAIENALDKAPGTPIAPSEMATLPRLEARNADISNLTGLEHATELTRLDLSDEYVEAEGFWINSNSVSDLSRLSGLTNLTELWLQRNNISDISAVAGLTNLTRLYLQRNNISDISPVAGLTNLTDLGLRYNAITDVSAVARLTNLTDLTLDHNSISDISAVAGLTNLTWLGLSNNDLTDISAVMGLTNLRRLALVENNISDISAVAELTQLTGLWLWDNAISDISVLVELTNLTELYLQHNNISNLSPLVANTGLGSGDTVNVKGNPLSYPSIHTHIPTLKERGVDVAFNDRTPTTLLKISGDEQKGIYGEILTHPFVVEVRDGSGGVFEGVPVVFDVTAGGGTLSVTSPTTDANGRAESTFTFGNNVGTNTVSVSAAEIQGTVTFNAVAEGLEFDLSVPMGTSLIHVPLKVTTVDGVTKTLTSIADLYDALGGVDTVNSLVTHDPHDLPTQKWRSYVVPSDKGTPADRTLTDDTGIIAVMKTPVSLRLSGTAWGTDGTSTITLSQDYNLVGLPLRDERINRVSDLLRLDGIWGNVPVIILNDGGKFKVVGRAGDPGDIAITGGGAFILDARQPATVTISGEAWTNVSEAAAAPLIRRKGIEVGDATPVLALRGSVVDEEAGLKVDGFRVTVKNLSTGRAVTGTVRDEEAGYRLTVVDVETARAATIGDILEILAQSPNPFIGVQPVRYTVTVEDVRQSWIQLPTLIAYEIPTETQLLANYPNPFNPETWIPYRLAEDGFVTLTIYDGNGRGVRILDVGHRVAAFYESRSKAIYWDGRNNLGETIASGVYFYHLSAGDYSATRKMLILK